MFEPSLRSRQYLLPPLVSSLLICFTPYLIAHTMGLTSQYTGREWVLEDRLHQPELGIPGLLRIIMHSGLALFPMTMPLMGSYYPRLRFWCVLGLLLFLTGCAILFTPKFSNLSMACGIRSRSAKSVAFYAVLPILLSPFMVELSAFGILAFFLRRHRDQSCRRSSCRKTIAPLVLVRRQPVRPYHGRLALRRVGFRSLFDRAAPPLIALVAGQQLRSKITAAGIAALFVIAMVVTWSENKTTVRHLRRWLGCATEEFPFRTSTQDTPSMVGT